MAIENGYKANFNTLLKAANVHQIALVETKVKATGKKAVLICAMQFNQDDTITPVPLGVMIDGDPYEIFEDPTA